MNLGANIRSPFLLERIRCKELDRISVSMRGVRKSKKARTRYLSKIKWGFMVVSGLHQNQSREQMMYR